MSDIIPSPLNPTGKPDADPDLIGKQRAIAVDTLEWLKRLTENPDFKRYMEFLGEGAEATAQQASNIDSNDAMKRDAYSQKHFAIRQMIDWPKRQIAACTSFLKQLNEQPR
jgi:hypothetical protein